MATDKDTLDDQLKKLATSPSDAFTSKSKKTKAVEITESEELTEEELEAIEAEAKAEVAKEAKTEKLKAAKDAAKQRLKKQALFRQGKNETGDDVETVLITLAAHMPFIRLDGAVYYPGRAYRVGKKTAAVLKEQMFRGDLHDAELSGKNMKQFYGHRPKAETISPNSNINM